MADIIDEENNPILQPVAHEKSFVIATPDFPTVATDSTDEKKPDMTSHELLKPTNNGVPEYELHQIMMRDFDERSMSQDAASVSRLRYADSIKALVIQHSNMQNIFLYTASKLNIAIPVAQLNATIGDPNFGQMFNFELRVNEEGDYTREQLYYIAIRVRMAIDKIIVSENQISSTAAKMEKTLTANVIEIQKLKALVASLQNKKLATINRDAFVLAYLNNKGNFVYLSTNLEKRRTKHFAQAACYSTPEHAYEALRKLWKDRNNSVPTSPLFKLYSANMIECDDTRYPPQEGVHSFAKLREEAIRYENLMKVAHAKPKKRIKDNHRNKNNKSHGKDGI